jgi:hypothetical protein
MTINNVDRPYLPDQCQEPTLRDQANSHGKGEDLVSNPDNNNIMGGAA